MTKEIIDETSILYREDPVYQVVDSRGKVIKKDQELWERIMDDSRYLMIMDKLDRWTKLLGTVLVKVSFVDDEGNYVKKNSPGNVQLDLLHGGVYDIRYGASPYHITELLIGFNSTFAGFGGVANNIPSPSGLGKVEADPEKKTKVSDPRSLGNVNKIYWSPNNHSTEDDEGRQFQTKNPYGTIPAIPFFNQDPAHYYFLPINEPLIYANHSVNMRITDLNHIAKFQSFGVPVVSGVERPTSFRQGMPVDDYNQLKGGSAQSRFGGLSGVANFAAGGHFRNFDTGFGVAKDGNADANALGMSLGPDTAVTVGEKGDFKFAHPSADITGLVKTIHSVTDIVRINHGLRPKYDNKLPSSGYALMLEKMGVIEENIRRSRLFKEREQQLFNTIKMLWNAHHSKSGEKKFSEEARLQITYKQPEFPVDPKTQKEDILLEDKIIQTGDKHNIKKLYPYMSDAEINRMLKQRRKDIEEQQVWSAEVEAKKIEIISKAKADSQEESTEQNSDEMPKEQDEDIDPEKIDNRVKHSVDSSKQNGKNGDIRE